MSLFSNLPTPTAHLRPKEEDQQDEQLPTHDNHPPLSAPYQHESDTEHPAKRLKLEAEQTASPERHAPSPGPPTADPNQPSEDQVAAALKKIASHISNPSKFPKAASLLRQLLAGDALQKSHRAALFDAVKAAFKDFKRPTDPNLRRDFQKLLSDLERRGDLLGRAEKNQLHVYWIVGQLQNELNTDDSFVFNKVLAKIKEQVDSLPEGSEEDDAVYEDMHSPDYESRQAAAKQQQEEQEGAELSAPEPPPPVVEFDPFGLDSLMEAPKPPPPKPKVAVSNVWNQMELACMQREALLQVLESAKAYHKHAWAKTSVELLVDHYVKQQSKFCKQQLAAIDESKRWVVNQRAARKVGPSAKEVNRDITTFEKARAAWSQATVSHRGKVGAQGDAKSQNWLG